MTKAQVLLALAQCSDDTVLGLVLPKIPGKDKRPFLQFETLEVMMDEKGKCAAGFFPGSSEIMYVELAPGAITVDHTGKGSKDVN